MTRQPIQKKIQSAADEPGSIRDLDPNVQQNKASRPDSSVWVTASAGTGKTKVLTDRVLRLLLPRADGQPGTKPSRILCLTFTKAGAGEMALRLTKTLTRWAVMEKDELREQLRKLQSREPAKADMEAARRLFAEVADTPGGLKIMTIHSFCQSVLGRFPLEAGIPPHFKPLTEGDAGELLGQARDHVLKSAEKHGAPLNAALENIARTINEAQFFDLVTNIAREREQLAGILEKLGGLSGLYEQLCDDLSIAPGRSGTDILLDAFQPGAFNEAGLHDAAKSLAQSKGSKEPGWAATMLEFLSMKAPQRVKNFNEWRKIFITTDNIARTSGFPTKAVEQKNPACVDILRAESERLLELDDKVNAADGALLTRDLLTLGKEIVDGYQNLKRERAALDFDDLIFTTCALLEGRAEKLKGEDAAAWVLYKLDQGLDHILIDEAQDTNPEQWKVVEALTNEFAAGLGASDVERTVFVVGDEKQSIYSFQRASPEEFARMQDFLGAKIKNAGKLWDDVPLNISFRSAKSVLQIVDSVFNGPLQGGVSKTPVTHESFRRGQAGRVELWPLCETPESDDIDPWTPPTDIVESTDGAAILANTIAIRIKNWIDSGEILPAHGRAIRPGDIMILLRTRNVFFRQIAKALKDKNIPVSGTDRMILNEQIAVQDLLAFAEFALQPLDDLTLAVILKSPLVGMSEDDLFELAHDRPENSNLWPALIASKHQATKDYLDRVRYNADTLAPFDFFSGLLQDKCPTDDVSGLRAIQKRLGPDSLDPIDELLNAALNYEADHIPSLQNFLHWQSREKTEIKREMEEKGNFVRIMTVHGAKGLQAPIVILPDTQRVQRGAPSKADRRLLWPDKTFRATPLWSPRAENGFAEYDEALGRIDARLDEEYRRLLYVAMTRAEDRLYLAGYTGKRKPLPDSWHPALKAGMESIQGIETLPDGTLRLDNPQTKDPDRVEKSAAQVKAVQKIPAFLFQPATIEKMPDAPLRPSHAGDLEPAVNSPLQSENIHRFRRGNLTHKLLQILPAIAESKRETAAENFLNRFAHDLPDNIRASIAEETLEVLHNPEFAAVFGPGSLAEVPVTGKLKNGTLINGQIDRILITDKTVLIVDFKTNRPPPQNPADVPLIYRHQLAAYADVISQIYPGRTVSCALLWTDGPTLMPLEV